MNIKQTKENKEKFESELLEDLLLGTCFKEDLRSKYNYSERGVRTELQRISMFYPVVSCSRRKGYRIVNVEEAIENKKQQEEINEINLTLHELNCRIKQLKKRMKPLIAAKKVLEKRSK